MGNFMKWFTTGLVIGLIALIGAFFTEDLARMTGEFDRTILFMTILVGFALTLFSFFSLAKANSRKVNREIIASIFVAFIPLAALAVNGLLFTVYFIGK